MDSGAWSQRPTPRTLPKVLSNAFHMGQVPGAKLCLPARQGTHGVTDREVLAQDFFWEALEAKRGCGGFTVLAAPCTGVECGRPWPGAWYSFKCCVQY